jgi:hypothetical protein
VPSRPISVAVALVAGGLPALNAQAPPPPVIDSVAIETHDVFDSTEAQASFVFGAANALHAKTQSWVVRREVLFHAGAPLDPRLVAETERNLRRLGLFRRVVIDTTRVDGRLVARVVTYDGWTTTLETALSFTGNVVTWSAGLTERNVLGTGHLVGASYRKEVDRSAWRFRGQVNRALGSRAVVAGFYDDLSDGRAGAWAPEVPFRAFADRVGGGLPGEAADQRVLRFRDGVGSDTLWRRGLVQRGWVGWAPVAGPAGYVRVGLYGHLRRDAIIALSDTGLVIPDSVSGVVGLYVETQRPQFVEVTHYNGFAREEDIDLSTRAMLGVVVAPAAFGYARTGVGAMLDGQAGAGTPSAFVRLRLQVNGLLTSAGLDSGRVNAAVTLASRIIPRQATVLHVEAGVQKNPYPGTEFDLGHGLGPRAFDAHAFTGTRTVWGIAEHRVFVLDDLLGLFGMGFAGFADYGGAWYDNEDPRFGGDVGIGLRMGATRATGPNVGRLDLAYQFGDGVTGSHWVVSFGQAYEF